MQDLRIGVIGAWGRGKLAQQAHKPGKGSRLVAGADINPENLKLFDEAVEGDLFPTDDYRKLLERNDIDAVFITSPDFLHEEQGIAALEAGKAVYLEKPMAITIEGCDSLLEAAYRIGSKLYLGHNMRYFPVILKMKEIIDSGLIGDLQAAWCRHFISYGGDAYFKDWHSEQQYSNGLLLQKGAHDIDVIHWLCGGYTKNVVGMGMLSVYDKCERRSEDQAGDASWSESNWPPLSQTDLSPIINVEDHNMIMMQMDNGIQASYTQCHYSPDSERNYTFIGTAGRIENHGDHGKCEIHVWTKRGRRQEPDIVFNMKPVEGSHGGSDPNIVNAFVDFVTKDLTPNTSPIAARNSVAIGVCGHASMRSGCAPQEIPQLDPELIKYFENGQKK
ncbi:MAG: Gfo/Idh/MocA family oxidoreductase [Lentisphaerae bacterium]|nr:Gfo/Idh/MocA family oxidoreductase [Lentisphaerota bacterium]